MRPKRFSDAFHTHERCWLVLVLVWEKGQRCGLQTSCEGRCHNEFRDFPRLSGVPPSVDGFSCLYSSDFPPWQQGWIKKVRILQVRPLPRTLVVHIVLCDAVPARQRKPEQKIETEDHFIDREEELHSGNETSLVASVFPAQGQPSLGCERSPRNTLPEEDDRLPSLFARHFLT